MVLAGFGALLEAVTTNRGGTRAGLPNAPVPDLFFAVIRATVARSDVAVVAALREG